MAKRLTKEIKYIKLPEKRIQEIRDLVASWSNETKAFMRSRLNQYKPPSDTWLAMKQIVFYLIRAPRERKFKILKDPEILTDWRMRFEISGQTNPLDSWRKILEKEVSSKDYLLLLSMLDEDLTDVHVPVELIDFFEKVYRAHIRKEYITDADIPKAPLILIIGPSGSGKTVTTTHAIEQIIFGRKILPQVDLQQKKETALEKEPFWKSIDEIDPDLNREIYRQRKLKFYKTLGGIPVIKQLFKKTIGQHLSELEQQGVLVDYAMVTPNDYQTALAGEPGNYFKKAMGDPGTTSIRHIEEAHSAFGKSEGRETGVERQQRTLIDTSNIILDEIVNGRRDCLLIATTDQPERFDSAIYRRFVEKGRVIDISDYWKNPENLKEIVRLELLRCDIKLGALNNESYSRDAICITPENLDLSVKKLYAIFRERTLKITPSYIRKLVQSVVEIKGDFRPDYLDDALLVRKAFELVARNSYGDLYKKFIDHMDRMVAWEDYVGDIKNIFSEMANNCLFYGVSEEKGMVLNGPPGSGKTYLVRSWLSETPDVHDISTSPGALQDPINPVDGAVENLEKIYDIAKMIAPTVVFFDEGDALAPRRSPSGGAPSDKLTNKFLNIIDGEIPLNRVLTVLTTNRLDILDPALIRSKRLKAIDISGHLNKDDITSIVERTLQNVPLAPDLKVETIIDMAKGISNTPADYTAFVEKARSLRSTEYEVLLRFRTLSEAPEEKKRNFIKFNLKALAGILDAVEAPKSVSSKIRNNPEEFLLHYPEVVQLFSEINGLNDYPLMPSHLHSAREAISQSPVKKGKLQLDEFLEAELSQEPQIGFVIGVGASETTGVLLPIATSLTYSLSNEKVLVTGAVSSTAPEAAQLDMAVKMTQQSAQEAFTLIKNYLQSIYPEVNMPRLLGEFLHPYTIHHQLLSASYNVGGPSAGYALAVNTLSSLLLVPVYNDFGITGAPWTKGVKKDEVGGSVIIGGHRKKAEKVLLYLRRMFMPLRNYRDLETEFLESYWSQDKDILGVTHFGDFIPEVVWLNDEYEQEVLNLIAMRIDYKRKKFQGKTPPTVMKDEIIRKKRRLRSWFEADLHERLTALRSYLRDPNSDPYLSMEEIFHLSQEATGEQAPLNTGT